MQILHCYNTFSSHLRWYFALNYFFENSPKWVKSNKHFNKHLQSSYNKYGFDNFTFNHLETVVNLLTINKREEFNIKLYKANDRNYGYNKRIYCDTNIGRKFSTQHIENLSKSHIGIKRSKEAHKKIIESQYKEVYKIDKSGKILKKYKSIIDASNDTKTHRSAISMCCSNKLNYTGGYFWCFVDDYIECNFINRKVRLTKKKSKFVYKNTETNELFVKLKDAASSIGMNITTFSAMLNGQNKHKTNIIRFVVD